MNYALNIVIVLFYSKSIIINLSVNVLLIQAFVVFFLHHVFLYFVIVFVFRSVDSTAVNLNTTIITTHQGNTIDLKAQVTNWGPNKTIEVQWLRNEMKIVNTSRLNEVIYRFFQLNVSYVYSILRIKNVNLFDKGRKVLLSTI